MKTTLMTTGVIALTFVCLASVAPALDAPPPDTPIELADVDGQTQPLAAADRVTVALFLRPEQEWSTQAITDLEAVRAQLPTAARGKMRLVAVWVSSEPETRWRQLPEPWLELFDAKRTAARHQHVVAYPTTAVIASDGSTLARVASRPPDYARQIANALRTALDLAPLPAAKKLSTEPWRRHVRLAERLREKREIVAAIEALTEAEKRGAERGAWLPVRATIALDQGDLVGARKWISELEQVEPDARSTIFVAGRFARLDGRPADAEAKLRPLLATSPHDLELVLEIGRALEALDRGTEAAKIYRKALERVIERGNE